MITKNLTGVILSVLFILNLKHFSTDAASSTGVSVTVTWDNNAASTNFVMSKTVTSNRNYFAFALSDDQSMVNINVIFESTLLFIKILFIFSKRETMMLLFVC